MAVPDGWGGLVTGGTAKEWFGITPALVTAEKERLRTEVEGLVEVNG